MQKKIFWIWCCAVRSVKTRPTQNRKTERSKKINCGGQCFTAYLGKFTSMCTLAYIQCRNFPREIPEELENSAYIVVFEHFQQNLIFFYVSSSYLWMVKLWFIIMLVFTVDFIFQQNLMFFYVSSSYFCMVKLLIHYYVGFYCWFSHWILDIYKTNVVLEHKRCL